MNDNGGAGSDGPTHGLLVMAYGTPRSTADIESFYTHIRRCRAPEPQQLAELTARYEALGGTSQLAANTAAQVEALRSSMDSDEPGSWVVALGQKHAAPFIEDATAELLASGVSTVVGVVLAPHYSGASVGEYHRRARSVLDEAAAGAPGHGGAPRYGAVDSWHLLEPWLAFQGATLLDRLATMPERTKVLFTAHSLPERSLVGDPYPDQLFESAAEIARRADLARWAGWGIGWQSKGRTADPWRGPDVLEIIEDLADTGRSDGLLVVPQGFTSDHLEVGYDLDIEARAAADRVGLAFARTKVPNADPAVMDGLARLARSQAP